MESEISAADVCYALNGLLCAGSAAPALLDHVKDTLGTEAVTAARSGTGAPGGLLVGAAGVGTTLLATWANRSWKEAFLEAYECLARRGYVKLFSCHYTKERELYWRCMLWA